MRRFDDSMAAVNSSSSCIAVPTSEVGTQLAIAYWYASVDALSAATASSSSVNAHSCCPHSDADSKIALYEAAVGSIPEALVCSVLNSCKACDHPDRPPWRAHRVIASLNVRTGTRWPAVTLSRSNDTTCGVALASMAAFTPVASHALEGTHPRPLPALNNASTDAGRPLRAFLQATAISAMASSESCDSAALGGCCGAGATATNSANSAALMITGATYLLGRC